MSSHFNPSVTLAFWRTKAMSGSKATRYVTAQILGAIGGVIAANWSLGGSMVTAPASIPAFLVAQVAAGVLAAVVATILYPQPARQQATT